MDTGMPPENMPGPKRKVVSSLPIIVFQGRTAGSVTLPHGYPEVRLGKVKPTSLRDAREEPTYKI